MLQIQHTVKEIKNAFDGFINRMDIVKERINETEEERISEAEDMSIETFHN